MQSFHIGCGEHNAQFSFIAYVHIPCQSIAVAHNLNIHIRSRMGFQIVDHLIHVFDGLSGYGYNTVALAQIHTGIGRLLGHFVYHERQPQVDKSFLLFAFDKLINQIFGHIDLQRIASAHHRNLLGGEQRHIGRAHQITHILHRLAVQSYNVITGAETRFFEHRTLHPNTIGQTVQGNTFFAPGKGNHDVDKNGQ